MTEDELFTLEHAVGLLESYKEDLAADSTSFVQDSTQLDILDTVSKLEDFIDKYAAKNALAESQRSGEITLERI